MILDVQGCAMPPVRSSFPEPVDSSPLMLELLAWVAQRPRTYGETIEAWRTSCPRMPVWENAIAGGLIQVAHGDGGMNASAVKLTPLGQAVLTAND
jgi:hypothetical protein